MQAHTLMTGGLANFFLALHVQGCGQRQGHGHRRFFLHLQRQPVLRRGRRLRGLDICRSGYHDVAAPDAVDNSCRSIENSFP